MAIPKLIPRAYVADYYTRFIGKFEGAKQFMAFVTSTLPEDRVGITEEAGKRWYAVLHTFDGKGNHLATEVWFAGVTAPDTEEEVVEQAQKKRLEMMEGLGNVRYCDIKVRLFSVLVDGAVFGLIDESSSDPGFEDRVVLRPNDLLFHKPWNGQYDT